MTCKCGCGQVTPIAKLTRRRLGHIKGEHVPYARGHNRLTAPAETRFVAKVDKTETCWLWTSATNAEGYGTFSVNKRRTLAHRFSYELHVGPIPKGRQLDHLCRVRNCVNPAHLEPVTARENVRRSMSPSAISARTNVCSRGHKDQWVSSGESRQCGACRREWREANRDAINATRRARRAARRAEGKVAS